MFILMSKKLIYSELYGVLFFSNYSWHLISYPISGSNSIWN